MDREKQDELPNLEVAICCSYGYVNVDPTSTTSRLDSPKVAVSATSEEPSLAVGKLDNPSK